MTEGQDGTGPDVVVYSDYVCPYSYIAHHLIGRLLEGGPLVVERRAFELRPAPAPLPSPDDPALRAEWRDTILPLAESLEIEVGRPPVQPRSRQAHEMAQFARSEGRFEVVHDALFRAYFVEGRDIGRMDVLLEIGGEAGIDVGGLHVALGIDQQVEALAEQEREAERYGVDGVPTFRMGDALLVGLHPPDRLRAWIARNAYEQRVTEG